MAEEKKKKTLFQMVKLLLTLLNLLYGLNLGNRKPPGCLKELRRKLHKHLVWLCFFVNVLSYYVLRINYAADSLFRGRFYFLLFLLPASFFLFAFNEPEMERLMRRLKRHKMGRMSERVTSRMIKVFLLTLAPVALPVADVAWIILSAIVPRIASVAQHLHMGLLEHMAYLFFASLFCSGFLVPFIFFLTVMIFPVLTSCIYCVLVSYCPSRLDDHVEDILRAHSPLRRATLLSKVCYEYYQLQPLASMTNRSMATTMSFMKIVTLLLWAITCGALEKSNYSVVPFLPVLQYSIPLLMYLLLAPSANNMQFKLFETAAEVLMVDDQWQGHDPISRSLLMKMRLNLLQHLVHIQMDSGPFTLLGNSVDPETLFMIFIEANDLRTTLR